jgi:hypothetical protein
VHNRLIRIKRPVLMTHGNLLMNLLTVKKLILAYDNFIPNCGAGAPD